MNIIALIYIITSVVYECFNVFFSYKKIKKKINERPDLKDFINIYKTSFLNSKNGQYLKSKVWNWYIVSFVYVPMFIVISQFLFPFSLFSHLRKLIFGKSELQKEAEDESKKYEDAKKKSDEWLKNEGDINPENDNDCIPSTSNSYISNDDLNNN